MARERPDIHALNGINRALAGSVYTRRFCFADVNRRHGDFMYAHLDARAAMGCASQEKFVANAVARKS